MSRSSHHNMESFSRFVIAVVFAVVLFGVIGWALVAFDDHGCGHGVVCHTPSNTQQTTP